MVSDAALTSHSLEQDSLEEILSQVRVRMPGPPFREVLRWIHEDLRPRNYVEIGVNAGASLRAALAETRCIGIDPEPLLDQTANSQTRIFAIYAMTSDHFFATVNLATVLGEPTFQLAFIDGLHLSEQVIQDFLNLERYAGKGSVILVHDCLPFDSVTAGRVRETSFYSGDTWKFLVFLKRRRPYLKVTVIPTLPTGLAIISGFGDADPKTERDPLASIEDIRRLDWSYYERHSSELAPSLANSRESVREYLSAIYTDSH